MQYPQYSVNECHAPGVWGDVQRDAAAHGYNVLGTVLIDAGDDTALVHHAVVDEHGILLIHVEPARGEIRGSSDTRTWTCAPAGGKQVRFPNPLRRNDRNRQVLQRLLVATGRNIESRYLQSLVVFPSADISQLRLSDVDSMRVVTESQVLEFVRSRRDFPPNVGGIDWKEVNDLVSFLHSLDRSRDASVVARHSAWIANESKLWKLPAKQAEASPISRATGIIFNLEDRYPDGSQRLPREKAGPRLPTLVLLCALLVGVAAWVYQGDGAVQMRSSIDRAFQWYDELSRGSQPAVAPAVSLPAEETVGYDVASALQRLAEAEPTIYRGLLNRDRPILSVKNGLPTYTWSYTRASKGTRSPMGLIAITIDSSGRIVGVSQR